MKIAVVGAGAMGSVYAALLAEAGNEVWAVDVWPEHVSAIRRDGLRIEGASGDRTVRLEATTDPGAVGTCDLAIIATKARHVAGAARAAAAMLGPETPVLTIQNGLGSGETANAVLGAGRVVIGVAGGFGARVLAPGRVRHEGMELIRLGEFDGPVTPRLEEVARVWSSAGFRVRTFDDIHQLVWEKLICNGTYSPVCTLTDLTIGEVIDSADAWPIAASCAAEGGAVARAKGIRLEFDDAAAYARDFGSKIPHGRPSMWQDKRARRPGEIDAINGGIARTGREVDVATPTHDLLIGLVKSVEAAFAA